MTNYTEKHSILGMMSKTYTPFEDYSGYIKNKKEVVLFNENYQNYTNYEKINLNYVNNNKIIIPGYIQSSKYKMEMLISCFKNDYFSLKGQEHREVRETRNKYNKIVTIRYNIDSINRVLEFIEEWDNFRGKNKYGWQLRSGKDKNFFNKYWESEKSNLWSNLFYIDEKLVGYSIISKINNENCYNYLIRKNDTSYRNLCLYIDYKSFERIWCNLNNEFYINWGCSSGNLLKYKKKFPVYSCEKRYFLKYKKENTS